MEIACSCDTALICIFGQHRTSAKCRPLWDSYRMRKVVPPRFCCRYWRLCSCDRRLYTGRRSTVVCKASFRREPGRTWVDVDRGYLWPPERARITKEQNPPASIPDRLLPHPRRGVIGDNATSSNGLANLLSGWTKTLKETGKAAGLGDDVTPHVLRHTAATWLMQTNVEMLVAGRFLGVTTRTLKCPSPSRAPGRG